MKLLTVFEKQEIIKHLAPMVVVEMWKKVMTTGVGKRKFAEAFTAEEQDVVRKTHKTYCHWCLGVSGSGIPDKHVMKISAFQLMSRAAKFFGEFGV